MLVWLNRLKASPIKESFIFSRMVKLLPIRKSTSQNPGPVKAFRTSLGTRDDESAVPELFTVPPVSPPAGPPLGKPLMVGVTGWPLAAVTMLDRTKPSRISRAARFESLLKYGGIHTTLP